MNCEYWKDIIARLRTESVWASHVLSTCIDEEDSNLNKALKCVNAKEIIENTIYAYQDWDAQPYCDEILFQFKKHEIAKIFEQIKNPNENIKKGILRFLEL
jgi:hypothetical protein